MALVNHIQQPVQLCQWIARHQHIERPPTQHTVAPQERQQRLLHRQMSSSVIDPPPQGPRHRFVAAQVSRLAHGAARPGHPPHGNVAQQGVEVGRAPPRTPVVAFQAQPRRQYLVLRLQLLRHKATVLGPDVIEHEGDARIDRRNVAADKAQVTVGPRAGGAAFRSVGVHGRASRRTISWSALSRTLSRTVLRGRKRRST